MARLRYNSLSTTLGASLTSAGTAITFAAALTHAGGNVPTISAGDYIPLSILDSAGKAEIVYLTAYTSGATTGTITRGQEGSAAASHASGDKITHGPTVLDMPGALTQLRKSADQNCPNGTWTAITWDIEDYDGLAGHDNTTNPSRIVVPTTGVYSVSVSTTISISNASGTVRYLSLYVNGVQQLGWQEAHGTFTGDLVLSLTRDLPLSAGDYVEAFAFQNGSGTGSIRATSTAGSILTARRVSMV